MNVTYWRGENLPGRKSSVCHLTEGNSICEIEIFGAKPLMFEAYLCKNREPQPGKQSMVKCHEYFRCRKDRCVMFGKEEKRNCWEVENALTCCLGVGEDSIKESDRIYFCRNCLYYQHIKDKQSD
jgi:hypothetical protein